MKRILLSMLLAACAAFAQSATVAGAAGQISGSIAIPIAPSALTLTCKPMLLQKGVPVACTIALDFPQPAGSPDLVVTISVTAPGITVIATPASITIPAGSSACGSATTPCFTLTRP